MNQHTDHIVLAAYAGWSGGKFLLNCLGLSNGSVLQDAQLAQRQLDNHLTPEMKFTELMKRLDTVGDRWIDLELGCVKLFGENIYDPNTFPPAVNNLSNSDKYFFLVIHGVDIDRVLSTWHNPKLITFKNGYNFAKWRWGNVQNPLLNIRAPSYMNKDDLSDFSYINNMEDWYDAYFLSKSLPTFVWDCNDYLDKSKFLVSIKKCYDYFNLTDFNIDLIEPFYDKYMATLTRLRLT